MSDITFRIDFHGPFHVARGTAEAGLDRTVDLAVPLPASSLKGLLRAEARGLIGRGPLLHNIFGGDGRAAGWDFTDASFDGEDATVDEQHQYVVRHLARLRLAPSESDGTSTGGADAGSAEVGFLMFGEHVWARVAHFDVTTRRDLSTADETHHRLVLRAAGRAVSGLGGGRRRGEGWVTISDVDAEGNPTTWTDDDSDALFRLGKAR